MKALNRIYTAGVILALAGMLSFTNDNIDLGVVLMSTSILCLVISGYGFKNLKNGQE